MPLVHVCVLASQLLIFDFFTSKISVHVYTCIIIILLFFTQYIAGANRKPEPEQKSDGPGVMTRIPRGVIRSQPKSNTSRDDAMIELKVVEEDLISMPALKPQVDNVNQSPNLCLHIP